jgi:hypothetical protein
MLKTEQDCLDCFRRQIRRTAEMQGCSDIEKQQIMAKVEEILKTSAETCPPRGDCRPGLQCTRRTHQGTRPLRRTQS